MCVGQVVVLGRWTSSVVEESVQLSMNEGPWNDHYLWFSGDLRYTKKIEHIQSTATVDSLLQLLFVPRL